MNQFFEYAAVFEYYFMTYFMLILRRLTQSELFIKETEQE